MTRLEYLEILLIDCGFNTRVQRNAYLSRLFQKEVKYLDELTPAQQSGLINTLKAMKEDKKAGKPVHDDRDEVEDDS
jgi:hypothetical protein